MNTSILSSHSRLPALIDRLKQKGHRITPQRVAILQALMDNPGHPTVEQVYDAVRLRFPMTSLATVYKTLAMMKAEQEVVELGFGGTSRFDAARPYAHAHLICGRCGTIADLDEAGVPEIPTSLGAEHGFKVIHGRVDYHGLCPDCQAQNPADL